jgi:mRNA interferase MazF
LIADGQIVLFRFPQTDLTGGKLRPALVLRHVPSPYDDWLVCMVSSRLQQALPELDEIIREWEPDFAHTGLKTSSVIRVTRVAVVSADRLEGRLGHIGPSRLQGIRERLADWITADENQSTP